MQKSTIMVVPAGERGLGAPFEIVGGNAAHERQLEMGVRIDAARHHIAAAGVEHLRARRHVECGADRDDCLAIDKYVRAPRMIGVYDRAAADEERGHGNSEPANLQNMV